MVSNNKKAFTLIEMAIVLTILAMVLGGIISITRISYEKNKINKNKTDISLFKNAVIGYAAQHGKLPYPDIDGDGVGDASATGIGDIPYIDLQISKTDTYGMPYKYDVWDGVTGSTKDNICANLGYLGTNSYDPKVINDDHDVPANAKSYSVAAVLISMGKDKELTGQNVAGDRTYEMASNRYDEETNNDEVVEISSLHLTSRICNTKPEAAQDNKDFDLVAYYKFDNDLTDETGNGHDGTDQGSGNSYNASGISGSALSLDGNGYVDLASPEAFATRPNAFTYNAWVKPTAGGGVEGIVVIGDGTERYSLLLNNENDRIISSFHSGGTSLNSDGNQDTLNDGSWHMLTTTYDGTNRKLFLDGSLIGNETYNFTDTTTMSYGYIGQRESGERYTGLIDEVKIYKRALSETEVQELYDETMAIPTDNLVAHYPLKNNADDISGNSITATTNGTVTFDGTSATFDGTSGYLSLGNITGNFTGTDASLVMWVKLDNANPAIDQTGLMSFTTSSSLTRYPWTSGTGYFGTFRANRIDNITLSSIDRSTWHMLTITTTPGADGWKLYQNTTLVAERDGENTISLSTNSLIGSSNGVNANFDGQMANIRIYSKSLTTDEIDALYNEGYNP